MEKKRKENWTVWETGKAGRHFLLSVLMLMVCGLFVLTGKAAASSYTLSLTKVSVDEMISSDASDRIVWTDGEIVSEGDTDIYHFSVPEAGYVMISYQGWSIYNSCIQVLNNDLSVSFSENSIWRSSSTSPITKTVTYALEAGNYNIRIWGYSSNTGTYRVGALFAPASNTEKEPNDSFSMATKLKAGSANKATGFLSETDSVDYYRLVVSSTQKVKITFTAMCGTSEFQLFDANGNCLCYKYVADGTERQPVTYSCEQSLSAGTYYIKISPYSSGTGRYCLSWEKIKTPVESITVSGNKTLSVGKSLTLSAAVSPDTATNKKVSWVSSNKKIATVSSSGKVTGVRAGTVKITAKAKDGSGVKASITITVTPKKMSRPSVTSTAKNTMKVTWKKQSSVSGYEIQYGTDKNFSVAYTKKAGSSKTGLKITKLLSGQKYYVRIRAWKKSGTKYYYGTWSSAKSVRVK